MRPYQALRNELFINGISNPALARSLLVGPATISRKLNGKSPWTLDECYRVLDLLGKPHSALPDLFPEKGRNTEEFQCARRR